MLIVDPINLWGYFYRLFVHRVIHFASFVHIMFLIQETLTNLFDALSDFSDFSINFSIYIYNRGYVNYVFTSKNC